VFEIGADYVKLIEREEPELKHLVNKPFAPGYLLHQLSKCGIHLIPVDMDSKLAGIQLKTAGAENFALNEVMVGIWSFSFRSCKQNLIAPINSIILKMRENLEYDREFFEDYERDWTYVRWWENKVAYTQTTDAQYSPELKPGVETHACLNIITKGKFSEEANDRMNNMFIRF